jgi:hypothetical protein
LPARPPACSCVGKHHQHGLRCNRLPQPIRLWPPSDCCLVSERTSSCWQAVPGTWQRCPSNSLPRSTTAAALLLLLCLRRSGMASPACVVF